ncbi:hypothetical protein F5141DRAFT_1061847 [Pisolithus sp. B1]|nr:hypothetical protein F5141DRAFT_1061847 [Pisolithus sp. B1]
MPLSSPTPSGSLSPLESGVRETIEKITEITQLLDVELKASRQERDKAKDELKRCREAADSRAAEVSALEAFHDSVIQECLHQQLKYREIPAHLGVSKAPLYTAETLSALIAGECWGVGKAKGAPSSNTDYGGFDWHPWGSCSGNGAIYIHPRVVVRVTQCLRKQRNKSRQITDWAHPTGRRSRQGPVHNRLMQMTTSFMFDRIVCKPTSLLDLVSIPTNLLFKDSMKAWVIVATVIAVSCEAAEHLPDANILASARQESSMHGIGSMDAKFTSVQVPQFKSDLRGGAVDIVAVTVGDAVLVSEGSATRPVAR